MPKNENLELWDQVCKTNPDYTKKVTKPRPFTSISPMYQIKKATEVFGVQGIGWGILPESEKFAESIFGETCLLNYEATLFYKYKGETGFLPIRASYKVAYMTQGSNGNQGYFKIDVDARKKVATDAKTKGLSELGFSADVFLGMFDDPNYISERQFEESISSEEARVEAIDEFKEWCSREAEAYSLLPNLHSLSSAHKKTKITVAAKCRALGLDQDKYLAKFEATYQTNIDKLKQGETA